jgi:hypothetical protein
MILSSAEGGVSRRTRRAHNRFSEFIKGPSTSQLQISHVASPEPPPAPKISGKKRGKQKAAAAEFEPLDAPITSVNPPAARKRRKTIMNSVPNDIAETGSSAKPAVDSPKSVPAQSHDRTARPSRRGTGLSKITLTAPAAIDLPPRPRRVVLRVTEPEDALDQLLQKSSEPIPFLSVKLDSETEASISKFQAHAKAAAALAEKRAEFRRNNWYLPLDRNGERRRGPPDEPQRQVGVWDVILKAVEVAYRSEPLHLTVTRRICEAIRARAEPCLYQQATQGRPARGVTKTKGSKKQRDDPETVQRKKLAKVTVDLVIDQWKRVVLVSVIRTS